MGIKAVKPGFAEVVIQPYIPADLSFAEGYIQTIHGRIGVRWEKAEDKILLNVSVPQNVKAQVVCRESEVCYDENC